MLIGEVVETELAFKRNIDVQFTTRGEFPLGTIKVRSVGKTEPFNEFYASPIWNINYIPVIGEHVLLVRAQESNSYADDRTYSYFYLGPIAIQDNINLNPLPNQFGIYGDGNNSSAVYVSSAAPRNNDSKNYIAGKNFRENPNVKTLQPYEGDILFQGRFGQCIRFTSTQGGSLSQYQISPFWEGKAGSPMTVISNGHKPESGPNRYVIEDPNTTKSFITLSTDQRIKFNTSQQQLGRGIIPPQSYTKAQVIISSDRLLFNSTLDEIILSAKKTVSIATPDWQMDMDKLFTIIEGLLQQLADLTAGKAQFSTPMGGPTLTATNVTEVQKLLTELKTMKQ